MGAGRRKCWVCEKTMPANTPENKTAHDACEQTAKEQNLTPEDINRLRL